LIDFGRQPAVSTAYGDLVSGRIRLSWVPRVMTCLFVATAVGAVIHVVVMTRLLPGPYRTTLLLLLICDAIALPSLGRLACRWPFSATVRDGSFTLRYLHRLDRIPLAEIESIQRGEELDVLVVPDGTGDRFRTRLVTVPRLDLSTKTRTLRVRFANVAAADRCQELLGEVQRSEARSETPSPDRPVEQVSADFGPTGKRMLGIFGLIALLMSQVFVVGGLFTNRSVKATAGRTVSADVAGAAQPFPEVSSVPELVTKTESEQCDTDRNPRMYSTPESWRLSAEATLPLPNGTSDEIKKLWVEEVEQRLGIKNLEVYDGSLEIKLYPARFVNSQSVKVQSSSCVTATAGERRRLLSAMADLATRVVLLRLGPA
jgi:hypothetical protein